MNDINDQSNFLLNQMLSAINSHIVNLVDKRLNERIDAAVNNKISDLINNHHTMQWMNDDFDSRVREIADDVAGTAVAEAMHQHERSNNHEDEDNIHDIAVNAVQQMDLTDQIKHAVSQILRDDEYVDESRAEEIANNAIDDIDWDEKVKEALREILNAE